MRCFSRVLIAAIALLSGCQQYDIHINDRLIRAAPTLFTDYYIEDDNLAQCVRQAIIDGKVAQAEELTQLNCSAAGISTLFGLNRFRGMKRLKLSNNQVRNLVELGQLKELEAIWLDGNRVVDPVPLVKLSQLKTLDVSNNPKLQCPSPAQTAGILQLILPEHCRP